MKDYLDLETIHTCQNNCIFCFVSQMPPGLRESLYLKDEDFRFSYIYGSYTTMTSMTDEDFTYIKENKLSPLYISVHTMNPKLRVKMLKNKKASKIEEQLRILKESKISMHTQIVLCPGFNDGKELRYSLERLYSFTPYLESVGIVPVGLTRFRKNKAKIEKVDRKKAIETLRIIESFSEMAREEYGVNWVYAADELFILAKREIPGRGYYDGFMQIENGIGIARKFIDSSKASFVRIKDRLDKEKSIYVITSVLGEKIIRIIKKDTGLGIIPAAVENDFFGKSVTVSGLMTFKDIYKKIKSLKKDIPILIPGIIFNNDGLTLDGYTRKQVKQSDKRIVLTQNKGRDIIRAFRR